MKSSPKSILFVSTTLGTGGAERMLLKILQRIDRSKLSPVVVSLLNEGTIGPHIESLGIPVICLRMNEGYRAACAPFVLARIIKRHRVDLIQGWMYHGNLLAWIGRLLAGSRAPLSFSIRQSLYGLARERFTTRWVIRSNGWLSGAIRGCVFNSRFSLESHGQIGFRGNNMRVIPNGFDIGSCSPCPREGAAIRNKLVPDAGRVVGVIARFHEDKGHEVFLKAAAIVHRHLNDTRFLLIGPGVTEQNRLLVEWRASLGLSDAVLLLGERPDVSELNGAFDIACLASRAEAFPNVVGESMACGVPCVVTDVGDCAEIVGETGRVARPDDPGSLATEMLVLLEASKDQRHALGRAARQRIIDLFDIEVISREYEEYFCSLS